MNPRASNRLRPSPCDSQATFWTDILITPRFTIGLFQNGVHKAFNRTRSSHRLNDTLLDSYGYVSEISVTEDGGLCDATPSLQGRLETIPQIAIPTPTPIPKNLLFIPIPCKSNSRNCPNYRVRLADSVMVRDCFRHLRATKNCTAKNVNIRPWANLPPNIGIQGDGGLCMCNCDDYFKY